MYPWNLHLYDMDLFYVAQFSAIQDCLYRHLWSSKYLLFGDVDELFVPREQPTLMPLLQTVFDKVSFDPPSPPSPIPAPALSPALFCCTFLRLLVFLETLTECLFHQLTP